MNQHQKMQIWTRGYACAVATIIKSHGADTSTKEALESAGLTSIEVLEKAKVEQYDIEILRPTIREIEQKRKRPQSDERLRPRGETAPSKRCRG